VQGIASTPTTDLTHTKFAPRCFPLTTPYPPLLLRHDNSVIAGRILNLSYDHHDRLVINAELTHPLAKRMAAFSVGVTVGRYTCNKEVGATVHAGTLAEISVTDRPANPECLITHRHPPSANAEFYNLAQQWLAAFQKMAQVIALQAVQAQRARPKDVRPPSRVLPPKPPTQFSQLVSAMQE
jgi:hypothetical protein